jgi:prepilin-type N-terminal cleavage/methylation domain-containing protein
MKMGEDGRYIMLLKKNRRGFTLIELLVVLALMTILLSLAIPQFIRFNKQAVLGDNSLKFVNGLKTTQSLATAGVQYTGNKLNNYLFQLLGVNGDPIGYYRGYEVTRIDDTGSQVGPVVEKYTLSCGLCIQSSQPQYRYSVPDGSVFNLASRSDYMRVCSPGLGYYDITVDTAGRVQKGDFQNNATGCSCVSTCGGVVAPTGGATPGATPTNTPVPTATPTVGPTPTSTPVVPPTNTPTLTPTPTSPVLPTNTPTSTPTPTVAYPPFGQGYFTQDLTYSTTLQDNGSLTTPDVGSGTVDISNGGGYAAGKYGNGANFAGINNRIDVTVANGADYSKSRGAVEFWMRPTWNSGDGVTYNLFSLRISGDTNNRIYVRKNSNNRLFFSYLQGSTDVRYEVLAGDYSITANTWVHVRVTWDESKPLSTQQAIYLNGVEPTHTDSTLDLNSGSMASPTILTIGSIANDSCRCMVDEFKIHSTDASPVRISSGNQADPNDYLLSTTANYLMDFTMADGARRGEYVWLGRSTKLGGVDIDMATLGVGPGGVVFKWQYWNGTGWSDLSVTSSPAGAKNWLANGGFSYAIPINWLAYSINGGGDLYYIRGYLTGANYTTKPVENTVKPNTP